MKWYWIVLIIVVIFLVVYFTTRKVKSSSSSFSDVGVRACYSTKCFKDCMANKNGELDNVPLPEIAFSVCSDKCGCK